MRTVGLAQDGTPRQTNKDCGTVNMRDSRRMSTGSLTTVNVMDTSPGSLNMVEM